MNSATRRSVCPMSTTILILTRSVRPFLPLSLYSWRLFCSVTSQLLMNRHIPVPDYVLPRRHHVRATQQNQAVVVSSSVCGSIQKVSVSFYSQLDFRWLRVQNIVIIYMLWPQKGSRQGNAQPRWSLSAYPVDVSEGGCKKYENILWKVGLSCESTSDASEIRRPGTRSNKNTMGCLVWMDSYRGKQCVIPDHKFYCGR